jgi:hypothetical protein
VDHPVTDEALLQAASANFVIHSQSKINTGNQDSGPLLLISGLEDHTVPDAVTRSTLKQYRESTAVVGSSLIAKNAKITPAEHAQAPRRNLGRSESERAKSDQAMENQEGHRPADGPCS